MTTDKRGKFFQLDMNKFEKACDLGLYPAIAYLTIACGVQRGTDLSTWSVNALEKWAGIGRPRAKRAIDEMKRRNIIAEATFNVGARTHKAWRLPVSTEPDWVYLPNTFIKSAATEVAPIERLRKMGSIEAIRMIIQIYHLQDLPANGGLDWSYVHGFYERELITERGRFRIYGWTLKGHTAPTKSSLRKQFGALTKSTNQQFFDTITALVDLGLVEWVRLLVEREDPDAEIVFPCTDIGSGTEIERELKDTAYDTAEAMIGESGHLHRLVSFDIVAPVPDNLPDVAAVDVLRTRYRAHTSRQFAWGAELHKYDALIKDYREIASRAHAGETLMPKAQKSAIVQLQRYSR